MLSRLKRNFNIFDSPSKRSSSRVSILAHSSPLKRVRLSESFLTSTLNHDTDSFCNGDKGSSLQSRNNSPIKTSASKDTVISKVTSDPVVIEPLPSVSAYSENCESKITHLHREGERLEQESEQLDAKTSEKFTALKSIRSQIVFLLKERIELEDKIAVANDAQLTLRNLLNSIYNPSQELAKSVKVLIDDCHRGHSAKLEKLTFELNNLLETSLEAIHEQRNQFKHEIELHERTLATIQSLKENADNQQPEEKEEEEGEEERKSRHNNSEEVKDTSLPQEASARAESCAEEESKAGADDDCVILEDSGASDADVITSDQGTNYAEDNVGGTSKEDQAEEDDDSTDIDAGADDDDRAFTPLQAQRPV